MGIYKDLSSLAQSIKVRPRHMNFGFPDRIPKYWADDNPYITHFLHALSAVFPAGEKFFIDSVRHYADQIDDPVLKKNIRGFIGQEAHHSKHHVEFNKLVEKNGVPMAKVDQYVSRMLGQARKSLPKDAQLAITISLEHFTAIMAHQVLQDDRFVENMLPEFKNLIRWHAIEETEHKAVAFDVYRHAGGSEALRKRVMIETTLSFFTHIFAFQLYFLWKDGMPIRPVKFLQAVDFLVGRKGFLRKIIPQYLDYYKSDFHPWQHDNSHLIRQWQQRFEQVSDHEINHARPL